MLSEEEHVRAMEECRASLKADAEKRMHEVKVKAKPVQRTTGRRSSIEEDIELMLDIADGERHMRELAECRADVKANR